MFRSGYVEKIGMDLGDLEIFVKVVATGSMSAAGRALGLSPAAVSKRIHRLEEALGVRLLQRTTRQLAVTEIGQGYYERIAHVMEDLAAAQVFASGVSSEIVGTLKVAGPTSFGRLHIAPHLSAFMNAYPQLSVELVLSDSFTDLIAEGYDLAVRISELKDSGLVARRLAPVRRILCAAPGYVNLYGSPADIDDLNNHQCLPAHNAEPWRLEGPDGPLVYRPKGRLATNSSEVVREAVLAGLGIALRSTWDIGPELRDGRLVQVLPAYQGSRHLTVSAVYPSRKFLPAKVRVFIDFLSERYGPVPYWDEQDTSGQRG